jgi:rhodanese-related sulfurtransferase
MIPLISTLTLLLLCFLLGSLRYASVTKTKIPICEIEPVLAVSSSANANPETFLVDARSHSNFASGHIPTAKNIPAEEISNLTAKNKTLGQIPKSAGIIVYCSGGECTDSNLVAKKLQRLGYTRISIYEGGWEEWMASGNSFEK